MARKQLICILAAALVLVQLAGCAAYGETPPAPTPAPTSTPAPTPVPTPGPTPTPSPAEMLLAGMTTREKVGQLFIIRPETLDAVPLAGEAPISDGSLTVVTDRMRAALGEYPVGGVAIFAKNIVSPEQLAAYTAQLQQASAVPLFMAVDEEGGQVARLANTAALGLPRYQSAAAVAASGISAVSEMGHTIGGYLAQYGFNMDFAPDADVNTNPANPVIGTRAFSSEPQTAAEMAGAMADGLRGEGIIPVFKHFPGHGDTAQDSHDGPAVTYRTAEQMRQCEWVPFSQVQAGDGIMVGHISAPALTGDDTPATLSHAAVTDFLRGELGFQGVVITDALEMEAVTGLYTAGEAAVKAIQAGCDILLMPEELDTAFDAVLAAVDDGRISRQRLDESVLRILQCKQEHGLLSPAP